MLPVRRTMLMQALVAIYRVLRVSENVTRVYKQRDDAWRFYITLVAAVTDDNPGTSLSLLHGNEAEQNMCCSYETFRSRSTNCSVTL